MPQSEFSRYLKEIHRLATTTYADRDSLMEDYLRTGRAIFGMECGIVSRIHQRQYNVLAVSDDTGSIVRGSIFDLGDTFCSDVIEKRAAVLYHHVGASDTQCHHPAYRALKLESYISAPVLVDGEVFGTINFSSPRIRTEGFLDVDKEVIEMMADDIGKALSLYKRVDDQNESNQLIKLLSEAVEASNDGVAISDPGRPDNPLIYINKAFERITGYTTTDVLGKNCRFLQGAENDQPGVAELRAAIATGKSAHVRLKNFRKNGELFWNDFRLSPIFDQQNILRFFVGVQTDVTEDVRKQESLSQLSNQRKELMLVAEEVLAAQTEDDVVQVIVKRLKNILPFDTAAVYMVDNTAVLLRPIALMGPRWTAPDLDEWTLPIGTGIIGSIIAAKRGEVVNQAHLDPRSIYPKGAVIRQEHIIVQPMRSGEDVWGAFVINRMSERVFTDAEFEIVQFLTSYASLALQNILLVKKLKESEQSQRTILETISDGVISIDHHGTIFFANNGITEIFGYDAGSLNGSNISLLIPESLRKQHHAGLYNYTSTGQRSLPQWHAVHLPGLHRDGHEIPLEISFGESTLNGRRIFTGIIRDITERKRAEELLSATMTRLTSLIQTIQAGVLVEDETRHITLINSMICSMFGVPATPEQLHGADCSQSAEQSKHLFAEPEQFIRRINALLRQRTIVTNEELTLADGRTFERDYIPIFVDKIYKGHMWLYRDITVRKQNEVEIEKLARFPNENPNPILRIDKGFGILYNNDPARRMLQEVCAVPSDGIPNSWHPIVESTLITGKTMQLELSALNGTPIYLTHFVPVPASGYVNVYASDITERKVAEWEALKAKRIAEESMRAKQDFLAKMSHELRTPMNAVLGLTNLLLNTGLTAEQTTLLHGIKSSGGNLLVIINDILDLAKIEAGKMAIDKNDLVLREMTENILVGLRPMAEQKGITLTSNIETTVPAVIKGDGVRLGQVLINLLSNAIKFTHEGGVTFTCSTAADANGDATLQFIVRDTGIGIPVEKQRRVFEAFSQASQDISVRYGGTGLGLTIVHQLVTLMDGTVTVVSKEGEGSTFTVQVPLIVSTGAKASLTARQQPPVTFDALNGTVLLVEDNPTNQLVAVKTMELWNIDVEVASDGYEALERLRKKRYDLVLMDIQMPGIDGFETTRRIRTTLEGPMRSVPIVAMTASVLYDPESRAINAGMNGYVSKPFELEDLYNKLSEFLSFGGRKGSTAAGPSEPEEPSYRHLDTAFLKSIARGNEQFVTDMILLFEKNSPKYLVDMRAAFAAKDYEALKRTAHTMKPTGAYIGIAAMKPLVTELEMQAEQEAWDDVIDGLLHQLEVLCDEIYSDIHSWKDHHKIKEVTP
jgi:PAS domain S-box-containing protein